MSVTPGRRRPGGGALTKPVSVRVDTEIWTNSQALANSRNMSMSQLVSNLLEGVLSKEIPFPQTRVSFEQADES